MTATKATPKPALSYSFAELAEAVGCSVDMVQRARRDGALRPSFIGTKAVVPIEEARRWIASLPSEKPDAS